MPSTTSGPLWTSGAGHGETTLPRACFHAGNPSLGFSFFLLFTRCTAGAFHGGVSLRLFACCPSRNCQDTLRRLSPHSACPGLYIRCTPHRGPCCSHAPNLAVASLDTCRRAMAGTVTQPGCCAAWKCRPPIQLGPLLSSVPLRRTQAENRLLSRRQHEWLPARFPRLLKGGGVCTD